MPLKLDCPVEGCDGFCQAGTEDEVMEQAREHVESAHPEMELDEATVNQLQDSIYEV